MKTIHKYTLTGDETTLLIPIGAKILTVQFEIDWIRLYAEIDTKAEKEEVRLEIYTEGKEMYENMGVSREYIGSVKFDDETKAHHVYKYTGV